MGFVVVPPDNAEAFVYGSPAPLPASAPQPVPEPLPPLEEIPREMCQVV